MLSFLVRGFGGLGTALEVCIETGDEFRVLEGLLSAFQCL